MATYTLDVGGRYGTRLKSLNNLASKLQSASSYNHFTTARNSSTQPFAPFTTLYFPLNHRPRFDVPEEPIWKRADLVERLRSQSKLFTASIRQHADQYSNVESVANC